MIGSSDSTLDELVALANALNKCPETGYREYKTSALLREKFCELPLMIKQFKDIPGFAATLDTGKPGATIAILCELDAITCPEYKDADPITGAAHCCGHNAQMAMVYGAAKAIIKSGILDVLSGRICFMAVPAGECIELGYRNQLRQDGKIRFIGGKSELISQGLFDDIDVAVSIHSLSAPWRFGLASSMNGLQIKTIDIISNKTQASPTRAGVNTLDAALLGISALNAWRSTFREDDYISADPIITQGGDSENITPSNVHIEMLVRGRTIDAIKNVSRKVDRAFLNAAQALDVEARIASYHGYFPFVANSKLNRVAGNVIKSMGAQAAILPHSHRSTDLGDLSTLIPVIQLYISGYAGGLHNVDFKIVDNTCLTDGAKILAGIAIELLVDFGNCIRHILTRHHTPIFTSREEYVKEAESFNICSS
ncbi:MAG: hypothetical protein A2029_05860 [Chloroflexi bacterium RBG_19FT_COMBO_47_9]|nr:MAG: hypothetical protein A2Y53_06085 [Chloroflexi bacterium RBG_16_47_49]OGO59996.1 MAG: hypothetical protein A2029_05860 [Chloroflexi bacterium RBG_19FT_COMBO_47_9]